MLTIDDNTRNLVEQCRLVAEGGIATMAEILVNQAAASPAVASIKVDIVRVLGLAGYTAAGEFAMDAIVLGDRFALGDALTKPYGDLPAFCDSVAAFAKPELERYAIPQIPALLDGLISVGEVPHDIQEGMVNIIAGAVRSETNLRVGHFPAAVVITPSMLRGKGGSTAYSVSRRAPVQVALAAAAVAWAKTRTP